MNLLNKIYLKEKNESNNIIYLSILLNLISKYIKRYKWISCGDISKDKNEFEKIIYLKEIKWI